MTEFKIKESFEWIAPEFKIVDSGKNTIRIKGVAMRSNVISKNKRKYVDEELKKAARTWVGKPVTINHDMDNKAGTIIWMEYEKGALEYMADIKKNPYVRMIRDGSTSIKGVSIEANYLHNRCPQCGQKFWTEESFHEHMHNEHFIKTDPMSEPHGLIGTALSLVLSPEEPGYEGSSIELMEMKQEPMLRLLETVVSVYKEKEKTIMPKKASAKVPYKTREIKEQEGTPPDLKQQVIDIEKKIKVLNDKIYPPSDKTEAEQKVQLDILYAQKQALLDKIAQKTVEQEDHGCAEDEHWDGEKCVKKEASEQEEPCPEGEHRNEEGECVPDEPAVAEQQVVAPVPEEVLPIVPVEEPEPLPPPPLKCGDGFHLEDNTCVPDEEVTPQEPEANEPAQATETKVKLPTLMRLGEPFANYTDFADCVAKNPDKEDPDAYCASIKQKAEGETVKETTPSKDIYQRLTLLYTQSNQRYTNSVKRDVKLAENVNALNRAIATLSKEATQIPKLINKAVKEIKKDTATYKTYTATKLQQLATEQAKIRSQSLNETRKVASNFKKLTEAVNTRINKLTTQDKKLTESLNAKAKNIASTLKKLNETVNSKVNKLTAEDKKLYETINAKTRSFEKVLNYADKNATELEAHSKTLEQRVKEMEQEKSAKEKKVTETMPIMEALKTRLENVEEKLKKGNFKGTSKPLEPTTSGKTEEKLGKKSPYQQ